MRSTLTIKRSRAVREPDLNRFTGGGGLDVQVMGGIKACAMTVGAERMTRVDGDGCWQQATS